jgi:hypothetical protein
MEEATSIVVTSISAPNAALAALARGSRERGFRFFVVGDVASPPQFELPGCEFLSLAQQDTLDFNFARSCPTRHYARKNIGYLVALQAGAQIIIETDDDNLPRPEFWAPRRRQRREAVAATRGWLNVYRYFSEAVIWPRGLPLSAINADRPAFEALSVSDVDCPIQQGLADNDPDVDAIYRLVLPLPQRFRNDRGLALAPNTWCPFNSQNTTWWRDAAPLLYLPAYCSFRMTDIWRSFIAQRIAWENGWSLLFHGPTMEQVRNAHDLMRDFHDEVPGYLNNAAIGELLTSLNLKAGIAHLGDNLRACYERLVTSDILDKRELSLLDAWLGDMGRLATPAPAAQPQ